MQTSHPLFSGFPRLPRPAARIDAAEYAEKRGILNSKGNMSGQHHISPSASFRVFRGPLHALMPLKNAEKRGNRNRKREASCRHHTLFSASFRVFCGPSHTMMPLNALKNAEIGRGRAKRHAGTTPSFQRLSASSAAHCTK
jgi:hypothetical protein